MCVMLVIGLAVVLMVSPVFSEADVTGEESPILRKLDEIYQRLDGIEQNIRQLDEAVRRLTTGKRPMDVRQTPEYRALEKRLKELQAKMGQQAPGDPADIWRAMGDPKELSQRLDTLVKAFAPTIPEPDRRREFEQNVGNLKEKIGQEISEEELYNKIRERLSERLKKSGSEREKAWLQGQLEALQRSEGPDRKERIGRYVRIENVRATHALAQKYSVPREQMVKCGLAFVGYSRRPSPPRERRDRPGPPRGSPRGTPRPGRDRKKPRS